MKRAVWFLILALFILLVIEPNTRATTDATADRIPVYDENAPLRTNNDVETRQSASHALIVIDPARGGRDAGYRGAGQTSEKDLTMQLALTIGSDLEKAGYQVAYTRWYDDVPACSTEEECENSRVQIAKDEGADYVISLSLNQDESLHRGFSIFTHPDNAQLSSLAKNLSTSLQAISYTRYEGMDTDHYDSFAMLRDSSLPAVLLQLGYITNPQDYSKLSDPKIQERIGQAVTQSFLNSVN